MWKWIVSKWEKMFPPPPPKYPCPECIMTIMEQGCTQLCDKMEMDDRKLFKHIMKFKTCPDCGCSQFYEGPSGGMSTNIQCLGCAHKFNNTPGIALERI